MRRFISYIGVTLLALLLSGSGNALAAALCPHAGVNLMRAGNRSINSSKVESAEQQQHADMPHAPHCSEMGAESATPQQPESDIAIASQPTESCAHCMERGESPVTAAAGVLTLKKLDAGVEVAPPAPLSTALASNFTRRFTPTQHAPPGPNARRHPLLSVLLI